MSEMGMAMMGSGVATGEDRARVAAEAAISSPLLEDINLAGANGILVNVTAGMDLSIGEFQEVGDTVRQFASDDATVVVGTVIDPEMSQEIRVTVVATGLGKSAVVQQDAPMRIVTPPRQPREREREADYRDFDTPSVSRRREIDDEPIADEALQEMLDVPAFLRRQAN
jgi:cell division protein FtsZ